LPDKEGQGKHTKDEKVIGRSQHTFVKGLSCWTNPEDFCDKVTAFIDVEKTMDVVYLSFSKEFSTVSYNVIHKLIKCGLDMWTVR